MNDEKIYHPISRLSVSQMRTAVQRPNAEPLLQHLTEQDPPAITPVKTCLTTTVAVTVSLPPTTTAAAAQRQDRPSVGRAREFQKRAMGIKSHVIPFRIFTWNQLIPSPAALGIPPGPTALKDFPGRRR